MGALPDLAARRDASTTVSTKVNQEGYARFDLQAGERGLTMSEWCREVLLGRNKECGSSAVEETQVRGMPTSVAALKFDPQILRKGTSIGTRRA